MNISIRVLNKTQEEVEISWQSSEAMESYRVIKRRILENFLSSWENFIYKNSVSESEKQKALINTRLSSQIQRELEKKSATLESLLFGDLWSFGRILPDSMDEIELFNFTTDLDWSGLPFEILSIIRNKFSPIGLQFPVRRRIRSRNLPKKEKTGKGFLLWFIDGNHTNIQSSLIRERKDMESYLDLLDVDYSTQCSSSYPNNIFIQELNQSEYLHFAGHSEKDHIPFKDNEKMYWSDLSGLDLSNIKIAFLNSCYSGLQSTHSTGIVSSFLESGVKEFVGFSNVIDTKKAILIGIEFWKSYFKVGSVDKAILFLRKYILENWGRHNLIPFILVHFSQSTTEPIKSSNDSSNHKRFLSGNILKSLKFNYVLLFFFFFFGFITFVWIFNLYVLGSKDVDSSTKTTSIKYHDLLTELKKEKNKKEIKKPSNKMIDWYDPPFLSFSVTPVLGGHTIPLF